jgi:NADH-quinone oxidoreductase subunit J
MEAIFFWLFAVLVIGAGVAVIVNRNPISSALSLVACFTGLAALFVTLEAFFVAAVQIIVYAGAVMVLFLFILMLLDIKAEAKRPIPWFRIGLMALVTAAFGVFFAEALDSLRHGQAVLHWGEAPWTDGAKAVGRLLFTDYLLPFWTTAVLLLLATIGVVILSKKELE